MASEKKVVERKILVIGPSWVGDMVMAQSLFILLKSQDKDVIIDVLAPNWSQPIISRMPEVRRSIDMPIGHGSLNWKLRREIGIKLRIEKYNQAIILPNSLKSALIPWFAKIKCRTGWTGEMRFGLINDIRGLKKKSFPLMVQRFAALALTKGTILPKSIAPPLLKVDKDNAKNLIDKLELNSDRKILILCPGAEFGPSKQWPSKYYAEVAANRISEGWQVWLLGSEKDKLVGQEIIKYLSKNDTNWCHNLAGLTQLDEAIDLLSLADIVITNDSGLMHISAAINVPLIVLYGSTSPDFTPPLNSEASILSIPVECGPCFKRECPINSMKCLDDLSPASVISELLKQVGN
ncbi:MAG: lipopolysaccharide heptosyltransferase II [Porticoccus sp.]|jgi:heptosyltransferase-2|nr:lipopolysaccharide heptosyltransferase II [Porticoccus sp.]